MNPRHLFSNARLSFPLATAIAALLAAQSVQALTYTWIGNYDTTATWNQATQWSENTSPSATEGHDFIFNDVNQGSGISTFVGSSRDIKSLTFNGSAAGTDLAYNVALSTSGAGGTAANLTFISGNTGITVAATDSAAHIIGQRDGSIILEGSLPIAHNGVGTLTINRPITDGASTFGVTKSGTGLLVLSGANTYTGGTFINQGTLQINTGGRIGSGTAATSALTLGSGVIGTQTANSVGNLTLNTSNTVGAITVRSNTSNTTTAANIGLLSIAAGSTLTATSFTAGLVTTDTTNTTFTALGTGSTPGAGGTLTVNGNMAIGQGTTNDANANSTTLVNLSGLNTLNVTSTAGSLTVGFGRKDSGTLVLANDANTLNVGTLSVGNSNNANAGGLSTLTLGSGTNALQAPTITIGAGKASGRIQFGGASGTVAITGAGGNGTSAITLASHTAATSGSGTSSLLLAGHDANVDASTVTLSQASGANAAGGSVNSLLTFDEGTFDATTIQMAVNTANTKTGAINGQFTIGGGAVTVTGNVLLASDTSDDTNVSAVTGTLTINGGTVNVGSGATSGIYDATTATAHVSSSTTLTLDGGTLNLNGGAIGGTANAGKRNITNLNFRSGTLQNVLQINDGAGLTKTTAGTLILSGTNSYTGETSVNGGTLEVALGASTAAGSAVTVTNSGSALVVNGTVNGTLLANASTTISGTGTVVGAATINGLHSPGNSPGIQTFTNGLNYGGTATLNAEFVGNALALRGTDFDGVNVTGGNLTVDSLATFALFTSGIDYGDTLWDSTRHFTVIAFSGAGTSTGSFVLDTANAGSFASEGSWSLANTSNDIMLSWTPIPEPNVAALIGAFGGILLLRRRR